MRATRSRSVAGRILSALPILFMVFDGAIKVANVKQVADSMIQLGWPVQYAVAIGVLALACTAVYAIPRTALLGAVLLTGYFGGAIATQLRATGPSFPTFFPLIIAALVWGGLFLRDERVLPMLIARR